MRLIDADTAMNGVRIRCIGKTDVVKVERSILMMLHSMPTVDAIPVEWIEQYKQSIGSQTLVGYRWIEQMQKAWAERRDDDHTR